MNMQHDQYEVEAIVSIDARGQIVLPKDVRAALGLEAGSKLAVVIKRSAGAPCCINLMPARSLSPGVQAILEPAIVHGGSR